MLTIELGTKWQCFGPFLCHDSRVGSSPRFLVTLYHLTLYREDAADDAPTAWHKAATVPWPRDSHFSIAVLPNFASFATPDIGNIIDFGRPLEDRVVARGLRRLHGEARGFVGDRPGYTMPRTYCAALPPRRPRVQICVAWRSARRQARSSSQGLSL